MWTQESIRVAMQKLVEFIVEQRKIIHILGMHDTVFGRFFGCLLCLLIAQKHGVSVRRKESIPKPLVGTARNIVRSCKC